jgi:hypothetical protein
MANHGEKRSWWREVIVGVVTAVLSGAVVAWLGLDRGSGSPPRTEPPTEPRVVTSFFSGLTVNLLGADRPGSTTRAEAPPEPRKAASLPVSKPGNADPARDAATPIQPARTRIQDQAAESLDKTAVIATPSSEARMNTSSLEARREHEDAAPPDSEVWSGQAINVLLKKALSSPTPLGGPTILLEQHVASSLKFHDRASGGRPAPARDEGTIDWAGALSREPFEVVRSRFSRNYSQALRAITSGVRPGSDDIAELRKDIRRMESILADEARALSPGDYTRSSRQLRELTKAVNSLPDRAVAHATPPGRTSLRTVADVVAYCRSHGLEVGPAQGASEQQAYSAFYVQVRSYERGLRAESR